MPRIRWAKNLLAKINAQVSKSITFLKNACDMYPCCLWSLGALTILPKPRVTQSTWNIRLNSKSREAWSSQYFGLDSQCYILLTWDSTALPPGKLMYTNRPTVCWLTGKNSHSHERETNQNSLMWMNNLKGALELQ